MTASVGIRTFSDEQLLRIARLFASNSDLMSRIDPDETERTRVELDATAYLEVWLVAWPAGVTTGWHDHGTASGAFHVVRGTLTHETWRGGKASEGDLGPGAEYSFVPGLVHNTTNIADELALSVHAYSPGLADMTTYSWHAGRPHPMAS